MNVFTKVPYTLVIDNDVSFLFPRKRDQTLKSFGGICVVGVQQGDEITRRQIDRTVSRGSGTLIPILEYRNDPAVRFSHFEQKLRCTVGRGVINDDAFEICVSLV